MIPIKEKDLTNWENLTISNDFIFAKVMKDKDICKMILEILLKFKIGDIKYLEEQKSLNVNYDAKSVRLDIYVEDEDKVYNIEMQVATEKDLPKRSRYYQSMIDINIIEKGETYKKLKDSFVIFICTFDPFNKGLPKYSFENICLEENNLKLKDGTTKIFFNTKSSENEEDENIKSFLKYIEGNKVNNNFINAIDKRVKQIKENKEWRVEYMTLLMREQEKFEEGFSKGIEQGIEQERKQSIANQIKMLKDFNIPTEDIINKISIEYDIPKEEIIKYL